MKIVSKDKKIFIRWTFNYLMIEIIGLVKNQFFKQRKKAFHDTPVSIRTTITL